MGLVRVDEFKGKAGDRLEFKISQLSTLPLVLCFDASPSVRSPSVSPLPIGPAEKSHYYLPLTLHCKNNCQEFILGS